MVRRPVRVVRKGPVSRPATGARTRLAFPMSRLVLMGVFCSGDGGSSA
jgi:hypothetical protein